MKNIFDVLKENLYFNELVDVYRDTMERLMSYTDDNYDDDDYDYAYELMNDIIDVMVDNELTLDEIEDVWNSIGKKYVDWWND